MQMLQKGQVFRYERKMLVTELDFHQIMALVKRHPAMFYQPYPPRYINNFYMDTKEMNHYQDNVVGSTNRLKVRIRWYHQLFGQAKKPVLEFKIKKGLVGTKQQYPLVPLLVDESYDHSALEIMLNQAVLPGLVREYLRSLDVVLLNRYYRHYFATRDNRFRLTLDAELSFRNVQRLRNHFQPSHQVFRQVIVEIKYNPEFETSAPSIINYFPFEVTKSSKYVQGIERVFDF